MGARLVGPNCPAPAHTQPGQGRHHADDDLLAGRRRRSVSRSGTLTYEAVDQLTREGTRAVDGDRHRRRHPIIGTQFIDALRMFEADQETEAVVMIGEIGGSAEEEAAAYVKEEMTKPVFGFIAGRTAPPGRRMGPRRRDRLGRRGARPRPSLPPCARRASRRSRARPRSGRRSSSTCRAPRDGASRERGAASGGMRSCWPLLTFPRSPFPAPRSLEDPRRPLCSLAAPTWNALPPGIRPEGRVRRPLERGQKLAPERAARPQGNSRARRARRARRRRSTSTRSPPEASAEPTPIRRATRTCTSWTCRATATPRSRRASARRGSASSGST